MGLLTIQPIVARAVPHPSIPGQVEIQLGLGLMAQILAHNGVVLNVSIGLDRLTVDALRAQNLPVPNPFTCPALVDTGASALAIDNSIVQSLNLVRRGFAICDTASGRRRANLYAVSLSFPATNLRNYDVIRAHDVDLSNQQFKCLIGRDTMANWHLHYNGQTGAISISD